MVEEQAKDSRPRAGSMLLNFFSFSQFSFAGDKRFSVQSKPSDPRSSFSFKNQMQSQCPNNGNNEPRASVVFNSK